MARRLPLLAGALWALFAVTAQAAPVTISWTHPTTYTDGSSLPASAITRTRIEYGSCSGTAFGTRQGEVIANGSATTVQTPNLAPGTYCFRAYTTASGLESVASSVAQYVVPQAPPNPPALTTLTAFNGLDYAPVYPITAAGNRGSALAGLIPKGTACSTFAYSYQGHNYHEIDRAQVVRKVGASLPARVAAPCA